jgi:hypothetical protein
MYFMYLRERERERRVVAKYTKRRDSLPSFYSYEFGIDQSE